MSLRYDGQIGYNSIFDEERMFKTRHEAISHDFTRAVEVVEGASFGLLKIAARWQDNAPDTARMVYDALQFLTDCRYELEGIETVEKAAAEHAARLAAAMTEVEAA